jgi:hypothetical protein
MPQPPSRDSSHGNRRVNRFFPHEFAICGRGLKLECLFKANRLPSVFRGGKPVCEIFHDLGRLNDGDK